MGRVNQTVSQYLTHWLETYAATNTSLRTQRDYQGIVRRYLNPALGHLGLADLRPDHVDVLYISMLTRGLSKRTTLHAHRILKEALGHAVKRRLLVRNVCDAVAPPRPERVEMAAIDVHAAQELMRAAEGSPFKDIYYVALHTGLRRSEVLALRWPQVDVEQHVISVVAGLHYLEGRGLVLLSVKTDRSRRQVAISPEGANLFREIRGSQILKRVELGPIWKDEGYVFTKPDGGPLDPNKVTREFAKIAKKAGLKGLRLHDLRHAHATLMLQAGVNIKVISERLGHSGVQITLDTYAHVLPGQQAEAANKFAELIAE